MELHIRCLLAACDRLGLSYRILDDDENFVLVRAERELYFQLNRTPFNSEVMAGICRDKEHSYNLLRDTIPMPKTIGFFDYLAGEAHHAYLEFRTKEQVVAKIEAEFDYPVIIKRNSGFLGVNVFLCHDQQATSDALDAIFDRGSWKYDYVALAQAFVRSAREFRVVCFGGEMVLAYERVAGETEFRARYWTLGEGRAANVSDARLRDALSAFVRPACGFPGLEYVGFDVLMADDGSFTLLELNSAPKYDHYIRDNGDGEVVSMYERILSKV